MKKLASGFLVLLTMVALTAMLTPAWGQEVTGSIVGTVTDPSGAPSRARRSRRRTQIAERSGPLRRMRQAPTACCACRLEITASR